MRVLRLSLITTSEESGNVIVCICRGKSDREVAKALSNGAMSLRDLQRCGIGDQCGSCHNSLRAMLASEAEAAAPPCSACMGTDRVTAVATA
jgi:bacterioferritin-associated ferredoxin